MIVRAYELTAVYADRPLRDFAVKRDIMGQPCPLKWSLPRSRDELVHRTTDAVQSSLLRSPGFRLPTCLQNGMLMEHVKTPLCWKSTWPSSCQSATRVLTSFWRVRRFRIHS